MEWWRKAVVLPVRRAWVVIAARLSPRKKHDCRGILLKLHDEVQTCAYEDVQVMWEMLQRSETKKLALACEPPPKGIRALVWLRSRGDRHNMDLRRRCF